MIATLQRFITLGLLLTALVWASAALWMGRPGWAVAGVLVLLFGHAVVLGLEFVMLAVVSRADSVPRASVGQLLRAWAGEVVAATRVFCWRQPFFADEVPDEVQPPGRQGVVLVHGLLCNRGFWTPWLRELRRQGVPFVAMNLEPVFGSIDRCVAPLEAAVQRLERGTGRPPLLVCHSMGGLVARAWLRQPGALARVAGVVTIGTPHRGTWLSRFAHSPNTRQMAIGSAWLRDLAAAEPPELYRRFVCFHSHCDNIVFPPSTATLPGADNRHVSGRAHVDMAFSGGILPQVLALLERPGWPAEGALRA